jgi:Holliday junction resolvasome RuvABC endonuclease subunit
MKTYLGLDLGTYAGYCLLIVGDDKTKTFCAVSGAWDHSIKAGHDSPALKFLKFEKNLEGVLALGVDRVFYENVLFMHSSTEASHAFGAFKAKMMEVCDRYGVPYQSIGVGTVKKCITGKGNANKDKVIAAVRARGYEPQSDDEADAIAIALTGFEKHGG